MSSDFLPSRQYHLDLTKEQVGGYVILPGDPKRVSKIAEHLDKACLMADHREFVTYTGFLAGEKVSVTSTGIGGPSTAIAVEELKKLGAHTLIRVGTCGGMSLSVLAGDLVIPTGAIRMEGTGREYVPMEFPAVAHFDVVEALSRAAEKRGRRVFRGIVQCKDSFYGQHDPDSKPVSYELKAKWEAFCQAGALASEMESATLFLVAQCLGMRAGTILTCVNNQERVKRSLSNEVTLDTEEGIRLALDALTILIEKDRKKEKNDESL